MRPTTVVLENPRTTRRHQRYSESLTPELLGVPARILPWCPAAEVGTLLIKALSAALPEVPHCMGSESRDVSPETFVASVGAAMHRAHSGSSPASLPVPQSKMRKITGVESSEGYVIPLPIPPIFFGELGCSHVAGYVADPEARILATYIQGGRSR